VGHGVNFWDERDLRSGSNLRFSAPLWARGRGVCGGCAAARARALLLVRAPMPLHLLGPPVVASLTIHVLWMKSWLTPKRKE
jgi:hypothetical protein